MRPIPFKKSKEEHKREAVGKLESSKFAEAQKLSETVMRDSYKLLKKWSGRGDSNPGPPAPEEGWRLPRFSLNSFLSLLLHGFGASAFARNAYG